MVSSELNLGPLWEGPPKITGFRVSIPDPASLALKIINNVEQSAEENKAGRLARIEKDLQDVLSQKKEFQGFGPYQTLWEVKIDDDLLSRVGAELAESYSSEKGPWARLQFALELTPQAISRGDNWGIVSKSEEILQKLRGKGLKVEITTEDEGNFLIIEGRESDEAPEVSVSLGYKSPEMDSLDPEEFHAGRPDYFISIEDLRLSLPELLQDLRQVQRFTSYFVDSVYEVLGMKPPNIIFQISEADR